MASFPPVAPAGMSAFGAPPLPPGGFGGFPPAGGFPSPAGFPQAGGFPSPAGLPLAGGFPPFQQPGAFPPQAPAFPGGFPAAPAGLPNPYGGPYMAGAQCAGSNLDTIG